MKDQPPFNSNQKREGQYHIIWNSSDTCSTASYESAQHHPRVELHLDGSVKSSKTQLLAVAASALAWWEKHQHDLDDKSPSKPRRYPSEPQFVTHARQIFAKVMN